MTGGARPPLLRPRLLLPSGPMTGGARPPLLRPRLLLLSGLTTGGARLPPPPPLPYGPTMPGVAWDLDLAPASLVNQEADLVQASLANQEADLVQASLANQEADLVQASLANREADLAQASLANREVDLGLMMAGLMTAGAATTARTGPMMVGLVAPAPVPVVERAANREADLDPASLERAEAVEAAMDGPTTGPVDLVPVLEAVRVASLEAVLALVHPASPARVEAAEVVEAAMDGRMTGPADLAPVLEAARAASLEAVLAPARAARVEAAEVMMAGQMTAGLVLMVS